MIMPQKTLFMGMILGGVISFYNLWLLQRKADVQGEAAASVGKRKGLGMISRFAAAALGALRALRLEISLVGYIIGLMTAYPVIVIDYLWFNRKSYTERGVIRWIMETRLLRIFSAFLGCP